MRILLGCLLFFSVSNALAVDIQFPEQELARESVYPVFDNPEPVKRRTVETAGKVEVSLGGGWSLNDALNEPYVLGGGVAYHFNEFHAAQIFANVFSNSKSQYVDGIERTGNVANLKNAPKPSYLALLNYQLTPYYGKLSITKQTVMNLAIFVQAGLGSININGEDIFAWSLGFGQKLYFGSRWGLRADLRAVTYQAPNPFSISIPANRVPKNSEYAKQSFTNGLMTVSGLFMF
jgi:outer membrane beta-barrel protein